MPKCMVPKWLALEDQPLPHPYGLIAGGRWHQIHSFSQNCSQSGKVWQNWTMCISRCAGWRSSWGYAAKFLSWLIWSLITVSLCGLRTWTKNGWTHHPFHCNHNVLFMSISRVSASEIFLNWPSEYWNLIGSHHFCTLVSIKAKINK